MEKRLRRSAERSVTASMEKQGTRLASPAAARGGRNSSSTELEILSATSAREPGCRSRPRKGQERRRRELLIGSRRGFGADQHTGCGTAERPDGGECPSPQGIPHASPSVLPSSGGDRSTI